MKKNLPSPRAEMLTNYSVVSRKHGAIIAQDDKGLYGVVSVKGEIIVGFEYYSYQDVYRAWGNLAFSTEPVALTEAQQQDYEFRQQMLTMRQQLLSGDGIGDITFHENATTSSRIVTMPDGNIGIAAAIMTYAGERERTFEIRDLNGNHIMFLDEPELHMGNNPHGVLCSTSDALYVATYGNDYSYIACYEMGTFKCLWKLKMYGQEVYHMATNDSELFVYLVNGELLCFDKKTGKKLDKKIELDSAESEKKVVKPNGLAATNEFVFVTYPNILPGTKEATTPKVKVFDAKTGAQVDEILIPMVIDVNSITIDAPNRRVFLSVDDKIFVFQNGTCSGMIYLPTIRVQSLHYDEGTGCLLVSMVCPDGKVEIYTPEAIERLLAISRGAKGLTGLEQIPGRNHNF